MASTPAVAVPEGTAEAIEAEGETSLKRKAEEAVEEQAEGKKVKVDDEAEEVKA